MSGAGLMGMAEIAVLLGVSRQRVSQLKRDHPLFPEPVVVLAMGPVFTEASVRKFLAEWPRVRTGRPKKERAC